MLLSLDECLALQEVCCLYYHNLTFLDRVAESEVTQNKKHMKHRNGSTAFVPAKIKDKNPFPSLVATIFFMFSRKHVETWIWLFNQLNVISNTLVSSLFAACAYTCHECVQSTDNATCVSMQNFPSVCAQSGWLCGCIDAHMEVCMYMHI